METHRTNSLMSHGDFLSLAFRSILSIWDLSRRWFQSRSAAARSISSYTRILLTRSLRFAIDLARSLLAVREQVVVERGDARNKLANCRDSHALFFFKNNGFRANLSNVFNLVICYRLKTMITATTVT